MPPARTKYSKLIKKRRAVEIRRVVGKIGLSGTKRKAGREAADDLARKRAEAEVAIAEARKANERLQEAFDLLPQGVVFLDPEGRYILWNEKYADIYHRSADLFKVGGSFKDTLRAGIARGDYPEALGREEEFLAERLLKQNTSSDRHEQWLADGRCILIEERATRDGSIIGLRVDITELKQREASFRLLFEGNPVPMIVCSTEDGRIIAVNEAAIEHYGYPHADFLNLTIRNLQAFDSDPPWVEQSAKDEAGQTWKHVKADGSLIDVAVYSRRLVYEGRPAMLLALMDITERKRAEARLAFMTQHDALTGLPNRNLLRRRLDELMSQTRRSGEKVGLVVLDLDDFKSVNDALGHEIGDKLLGGVTKRLRSVIRDGDSVARLGSNEFAIVMTGVARPEDAAKLAQRTQSAISEPFLFEGHSIVITGSIGIAIAPGDGDEPETLLKRADMALSRAKAEARGTYRFFEPAMDARAQSRRKIETELRAALESEVLKPYYQPLIDMHTGLITGVEALVRWEHPDRGMIPPSEFIPVAEDTGLIGPLGTLVLRRACHDAARWASPVRVAVNLSPAQFRSGNLLAVVMEALKHSGLPARRLELEITEALLLDRSDHVLATLHALRSLGVRICMDDFGTGYSSLSYLMSFPFDKIKIDQSFVRGLSANADAQAIVRSIVGLGAGLRMTVTAEGVETEAELSSLRAEGCDEAQGFLFSPARPNSEVERLLELQSKAAEQAVKTQIA